ncbi:MAG: cysteine hydrolase [Sedimentisphaerales bacterium]|nr:cysteine hydrolase [Sedimentisphaerales bacterium]
MARLLPRRVRRVCIDIDTQYDRLNHTDRDRTDLLTRIRRLVAWARVRRIPLISTALSRLSVHNSVTPAGTRQECIEGTPGQMKIPYTLMPRHILIGPENRMDLPSDLLSDYQQVILEKRTEDPFTHPRTDRLLTDLKRDEFIVFGVGAEKAVKATVLGLLYRRKHVLVVADAIDGDTPKTLQMALRQMEAKGAKLVTTAGLTGQSRLVGKACLKSPLDHLNNLPTA